MTSAKLSTLSDTQLVILSAAAAQENSRVLPPPASVRARGAALKCVLESLLRTSLIEERPATVDDDIWRTGEDDRLWTLVISPAGLSAIEADNPDGPNAPPKSGSPSAKRVRSNLPIVGAPREPYCSSAKAGSKSAIVTEMLLAPDGASIDELKAATGWQARSVRGFLSGTLKKKLGYTVTSERQNGVRRYKIAA